MVKHLSRPDLNGNRITNVGTPTSANDAATKQYVDTNAGSTIVNTFYYAQKNLTGSGLTGLTGSVNGSNTQFTVPESLYVAGTLMVFVNGVHQVPGDAITETTPGSGVFDFVTAPQTGDQIYVIYQKQTATGATMPARIIQVLVTDPGGAALTTGDGKAYIRINSLMNGWNLTAVEAHVTTTSSSGTPTIQVHNVTQGADMLSTRITIDANEKDSSTAAAPAVVDTANDDVATGDELRIDVDVAGTGTKGLIVDLTFEAP